MTVVSIAETYTNASNRDTDGDNLEDYTEAVDGFMWNGEPYTTNAIHVRYRQ